MIGAGSLDEAKQSKKTDTNQRPKERKRPMIGAEEAADSPLENDEGASEEGNACIHLAPEQMFNLVSIHAFSTITLNFACVLGGGNDKGAYSWIARAHRSGAGDKERRHN